MHGPLLLGPQMAEPPAKEAVCHIKYPLSTSSRSECLELEVDATMRGELGREFVDLDVLIL